MTLPLAESVVEEATLNWFDALGYAVLHGLDIAPGESNAERTSYNDLALPNHSHSALT